MEGIHERGGSRRPGGAMGVAVSEGGVAVSVAATHGFAGGGEQAGAAGGGGGPPAESGRSGVSGGARKPARHTGADRRAAGAAGAGQAHRSGAQRQRAGGGAARLRGGVRTRGRAAQGRAAEAGGVRRTKPKGQTAGDGMLSVVCGPSSVVWSGAG